MNYGTLLPLLVGATVAWASVPAPALACEPCSCEIPTGIRPQVEEQTLPRNARFLIDLHATGDSPTATPESVRWVTADGKLKVAFKTIHAGNDPLVVWVVPDDLLDAKTEYLLTVGDKDPLFTESFKTSDLVDETPPEAGVPVVEPASSSSCGASVSARLVWESIRDNGNQIPYEPIVRARITGGKKEAELFLDASNLGGAPRGTLIAAPVDGADADCWGHFGLPFSDEESVTVQLTVYDRAGNALELKPIDVRLSEDPGADCPSASGDCDVASGRTQGSGARGPSAALVIALAGLFWFRGSRSRKAR